MNRRTFLTGAASVSAAAALPKLSSAMSVQAEPAINVVERFGFVPDGRADNYAAFHRLADYASSQRGGRFLFPPGDYAVQQFRVEPWGTRDPRAVRNVEFLDADGLTLSGYGARILINGRFHRSGQPGRDGLTVGVHFSTFMPFEIRRCRNIVIEGFEMDGGVRDMTKDQNVTEGYAHLIALSACSNVLLKDLDLHHAQVDGILLTDIVDLHAGLPGRACRNVRLVNVKCRNNARGGLAPLQVLGLLAENCDFNGNGFPEGRYGGHMPGFGIDIEPDRINVGVDVDTKTGDLEFRRCRMYDNASAILAAYVGSFTGYCRFIDCDTRNGNDQPNHIIATWPGEGILIQGGQHDAGPGCIWLSWQGQNGGKSRLRGATIRSSHANGIMHGFGGNLTEVEDCEIIATHREPSTGNFIFFGQDPGGGRRNIFRNNRVFIPAARKEPSTPFDYEPMFNNTDLEGNLYRTDLAVEGQSFVRGYIPENCTVRNERFQGAFPGTRDTFRPLGSEAHDTRLPFSDP